MNKGRKNAKHSASTSNKIKDGISNFFIKIRDGFNAMSKGKKALVITLLSVILVLAILIGIVLGVIGDLTKDYNHQEIVDPEIQQIKPIDEKIINIALFGIDSRDQDFTGLSDSIMVLSVNTETGDIKLISIMRDSFVEMPEYKGKTYRPNKINSAYSRGGAIYAIKTLNQNFGLDIKEYATVNFYGMAEIIDAVGGIEIEVLKREINSSHGLNDCLREQAKQLGIKNPPLVTEPGLQVLSGMQAVAWARIRSVSTEQGTSNDYGRTDRQRVVMEKLLNKALSMDVAKYPSLIKAILPHMETSLGFGEVLSLATNVLGKQVKFEQTRVPQQKYVINDNTHISYAGSVVYYDLAYASKIIHSIIFEDMTQDEYIEKNGVEKNKWYTGGNVVSSKPASSKPANSSSKPGSTTTSSSAPQNVTSSSVNSSQISSTESENTSSDNSSSVTQGTSEDLSSDTDSSSEETTSSEVESSSEDTTSSEVVSSETVTSSEEQTSSQE